MTTTHPDLLDHINAMRADPTCMTTRLVLADRLEELGRENVRYVTCPKCKGEKTVRVPNRSEEAEHEIVGYVNNGGMPPVAIATCTTCSGTGHLPDDTDARRAEYLRVGVELEQMGKYPTATARGKAGKQWKYIRAATRLHTLAASLTPAAWVCLECHEGKRFGCEYPNCPHCSGSGDMLRIRMPVNPYPSIVEQPLPITYDHAHYPQWLEVPTLGELVQSYGDMTTVQTLRPTSWQPTPRLTALAGPTPWGVGLEGVVPGDQEPVESVTGWWWSSPRAVGTYPLSVISESVFQLMVDDPTAVLTKSYPTPEAAKHALGRWIVAFGQVKEVKS